MMFALNFMAVRLSLNFSVSPFLIHNKATGGKICRAFAANNEFPLRGNIGGGAEGGTRLFPQGKCPAFWLARHHAGRMPQAKVCFGA